MPVSFIRLLDGETLSAVTVDFAACTPDALQRVLDEYGFCVVANVLTPADVTLCRGLFASDLRAIVDLEDDAFDHTATAQAMATRGDDLVAAWDLLSHPLGRINPSVASDFGIPQGSAAWYVRSHPRVAAVFAQLFGPGEALCTGMDCVLFDNLEPEVADPLQRFDDIAPRVDVPPGWVLPGDWRSFQAAVYITDVTEDSSATVVWPRSHTAICDRVLGVAGGDADAEATGEAAHAEAAVISTAVPAELTDQFQAEAVRVPLNRGSMVVWNVRTVNQSWNLGPRLAFPVSMAPKSRRSVDAASDKREWVGKGNATTHWPWLGTLHPYCSLEPNDDDQFPLRAAAHLWAVDDNGCVLPQIDALL